MQTESSELNIPISRKEDASIAQNLIIDEQQPLTPTRGCKTQTATRA